MAGRRTPTDVALARLGLRTAGIAHDLAQPLTLALLAARQVDGKGVTHLREALRRMEDLLQDVRMELHADDAEPTKRAFELAQMRRHLLANLSPAERRRTRIRLSGTATTNPSALQRILGNLVLNALRHGQGPVSVEGSAQGRSLAIVVKGGVGKRPAVPGWGIGLASCQELADRHGLTLGIKISLRGSTATLATQDGSTIPKPVVSPVGKTAGF